MLDNHKRKALKVDLNAEEKIYFEEEFKKIKKRLDPILYGKTRSDINTTESIESLLSKFKKGDRVKYTPNHALGIEDHEDCEYGVVSSKNKKYVFVKYDHLMGVIVTGDDPGFIQLTTPENLVKVDAAKTMKSALKRIEIMKKKKALRIEKEISNTSGSARI